MSQRTFLALDLEEATLDRLEAVQCEIGAARPGSPPVRHGESRPRRTARSGVRWVDRANLHLTMVFLGEVPDEMLPQVCDLASGAAGRVAPFEYQVRGIECVPPGGALRMIWADVADPSGGLAELHEHLAAALSGLGLHEEERSFRPHITLARVKFDRRSGGEARSAGADLHSAGVVRRMAALHAGTDFGAQYAEELVVYGSRLTPAGPLYTPAATARLGQAGQP